MVTYNIEYIKQTSGMLWWKKEEWVWAMYEEGPYNYHSPDAHDIDGQQVEYKKLLDSSEDLVYIKDLRDKLVRGEDYDIT